MTPVIQKMEQRAAAKEKKAADAAAEAALKAERLKGIDAFATKLASKKTPLELLRTKTIALVVQAATRAPLTRPLGTISPDLAPIARKAKFHKTEYLQRTCISPRSPK